MRLAFEGAIATASRPYGFFGKPLLFSGVTSVQLFPPSFDRKRPLPDGWSGPSPPERKVHPVRRKSHIAASILFGSVGSIARVEQPVDKFAPFNTRFQVLPPSVVL